MQPVYSSIISDEKMLSKLAMQFRGTRNIAERNQIANTYAQVVNRLIQSGKWQEVPPLEDLLPDDWMPPGFMEYWSHQ